MVHLHDRLGRSAHRGAPAEHPPLGLWAGQRCSPAVQVIDVSGVTRTSRASSGIASIWVEPTGANRIVVVPGSNLLLEPGQAASFIRAVGHVDLVLGQFEMLQEPTEAAFRAGHERGALSVLNSAPAAHISPGLLAATDWLVVNKVEFAEIGSATLDRIVDAQAPEDTVELARRLSVRLVVTLGDQGAALCTHDFHVRFVAPPRVEAIDTTGAGDAFVGAFALDLASGLPEVEAVRLGCACAALSVTRLGTHVSFPRAREVDTARAWASNPNGVL